MVKEHAGGWPAELAQRLRAVYVGASTSGQPVLAVATPLKTEALEEATQHFGTAPVQRIGRDTTVAPDAHVGSTAVLGDGVTIGAGSRVERSVILQGSVIGADCEIEDAIVAAGARIGDRTAIGSGAVLGEGVTVGSDNLLAHGIRVFPGTEIPDGAIRF